ncbi:MAG: hypothetical protein GXO78_07970 [Calditrichaeota bacterium]|nr:hypothetical protein [Calditrichota bacterium]
MRDFRLYRTGQIFLVVFLLFATSTVVAQGDTAARLKNYLMHTDFRELLRKYGQHEVQFQIKGEAEKRLEALPYILVDGYRVQIFAGRQISQAQKVAQRARQANLDSVYLVHDAGDGLYKVQVGDCRDRDAAHILLDRLYYAGFPDGWIVETKVRVPKRRPSVPDREGEPAVVFAVQVLATADSSNASQIAQQLKQRFNAPVRVVAEDRLWKVVMGAFPTRDQASQLRDRLIQNGYPDAWITQIFQ